MSTYTQILYQIVFSTKYREKTLIKEDRILLFQCIWKILQRKNCHLYQVNGVEDHLHIITSLHPSQPLAMLVKDIKLGTHSLIKETGILKQFNGWQNGYSAFTYAIGAKKNLINYVRNQEEHHRTVPYLEELIALLKEHGIEFDERYLD